MAMLIITIQTNTSMINVSRTRNTDGEAQGNANNKHNDKDNGSKASTQDEQCNVHMSTRMEYVSNPTDDKYNHQSFSIL